MLVGVRMCMHACVVACVIYQYMYVHACTHPGVKSVPVSHAQRPHARLLSSFTTVNHSSIVCPLYTHLGLSIHPSIHPPTHPPRWHPLPLAPQDATDAQREARAALAAAAGLGGEAVLRGAGPLAWPLLSQLRLMTASKKELALLKKNKKTVVAEVQVGLAGMGLHGQGVDTMIPLLVHCWCAGVYSACCAACSQPSLCTTTATHAHQPPQIPAIYLLVILH